MNVAVSHRQTGRDQLAELARRLQIPDWQTRKDGDGIVMVAGSRGYAKAVWGGLLICLRRSVDPAAVSGLLRLGVLSLGRDNAVVLARLPDDETEAAMLRALLGLHGGGADR
jgi:hypothetical protein